MVSLKITAFFSIFLTTVSNVALADQRLAPWQKGVLSKLELRRGPLFLARPNWNLEGKPTPDPSYQKTALVFHLFDRKTGQPGGAVRIWCHSPSRRWALVQFGLWQQEMAYFQETYLPHDREGREMAMSLHSNPASPLAFQSPSAQAAPFVAAPPAATRASQNSIYMFLNDVGISNLQRILGSDGKGNVEIQLRQTPGPSDRLQEGTLRSVFSVRFEPFDTEQQIKFQKSGQVEVESINLLEPCTNISRD